MHGPAAPSACRSCRDVSRCGARCERRARAAARRSARSRDRSARRRRSSTCPRRRGRRAASPCRRGCPGWTCAGRTASPGPVTTTRCGSQRMIRAPIETSLSTKNRRLSNIFSKIRIVPRAWVATMTAIEVMSAGNAGHGPSSIFGIAPPRSSRIASSWPGGTWIEVPSISTRSPSRSNTGRIGTRSSEAAPSIVRSPPVMAAMPMKLPTSMWSARDRVLAAAQPLDARDVDHVRADALDLARRARRGSGRGPGRAARTPRSRSSSGRARATRP